MAAFGEGNRCPGETEEQVGRNQTGVNGRPRSGTNTKGEADLYCRFSFRSARNSSPPPLGPTSTCHVLRSRAAYFRKPQ